VGLEKRSSLSTQESPKVQTTSVPAKVFHLNDRGVIKPGARADLVLVEGDPTRDILDTRRIVTVWKVE
jgi:imidazolonepropionase-like amidohydrolase